MPAAGGYIIAVLSEGQVHSTAGNVKVSQHEDCGGTTLLKRFIN